MVAPLFGELAMKDYGTRLEDIILDTPISKLDISFIMAVVLVLKDGSKKVMSSHEYEMFSDQLEDQEVLKEHGVVSIQYRIDVDYMADYITYVVDKIFKK